ncbi:MAG: MlaD family protein [Pseudomonadota bacterium]|nr:MlaD family protein [Pseudomonadota bacterium]
MERNLSQEIKVGLFVLVFLALIAAASFILGGGEDIFAKNYLLHTSYQDVKGMKVGAVVRLAGMDVGEVSRVEFSTDPAVKEIEVDLRIREDYQTRIRSDSVAAIQQIGVLGDMYVSLTVGSSDKETLPNDGHIQGIAALDMLSYADKATEIVANASSISKKVDLMLGSEDAASRAEIAKSIENIGLLLADAKEGKGIVHTLVYDKNAAAKVNSILSNVDGITADVKGITHQLKTGDGLATSLIYGKNGDALTTRISDAVAAVEGLLTDVRTKDSMAHSLLYDPNGAKIVTELEGAAVSLRGITDAVNAGEGTAGLLVRDPQLYEDLRVLLGGAQRNALLRAYIRATVERGRDENGSAWKAPSDDPSRGGR